MSLDPATALLDIGKSLLTRLWPDPQQQAEEIRKLEELHQKGDLAELNAHVQLMLGQIEINKIEAQSKSLFVAGWRPAAGWVAVTGLATAFVPKALALTGIWIWQSAKIISQWNGIGDLQLPVYPDLGVTDLLGLLGSMLGIGVMRSYDKKNKVQTDKI